MWPSQCSNSSVLAVVVVVSAWCCVHLSSSNISAPTWRVDEMSNDLTSSYTKHIHAHTLSKDYWVCFHSAISRRSLRPMHTLCIRHTGTRAQPGWLAGLTVETAIAFYVTHPFHHQMRLEYTYSKWINTYYGWHDMVAASEVAAAATATSVLTMVASTATVGTM